MKSLVNYIKNNSVDESSKANTTLKVVGNSILSANAFNFYSKVVDSFNTQLVKSIKDIAKENVKFNISSDGEYDDNRYYITVKFSAPIKSGIINLRSDTGFLSCILGFSFEVDENDQISSFEPIAYTKLEILFEEDKERAYMRNNYIKLCEYEFDLNTMKLIYRPRYKR